MSGCEKVNPYSGDSRHKSEQVRDMFDNIAPAYDFMNRAMTLGIDRSWRAKAIAMVKARNPREILDVATGTADLAIEMWRKMPRVKITGVDLSEGMIERGRAKVESLGASDHITLLSADCLSLPFADGSFDAVTVAFGVRNFENLAAGYREMARVLRSGGMLTVVELSRPVNPIIKPFYNLYTRGVIPMLGRIVSSDSSAYRYLGESIAAVPQGEAMTRLMKESGFGETRFRPLTFGVCSIYTAVKE